MCPCRNTSLVSTKRHSVDFFTGTVPSRQECPCCTRPDRWITGWLNHPGNSVEKFANDFIPAFDCGRGELLFSNTSKTACHDSLAGARHQIHRYEICLPFRPVGQGTGLEVYRDDQRFAVRAGACILSRGNARVYWKLGKLFLFFGVFVNKAGALSPVPPDSREITVRV